MVQVLESVPGFGSSLGAALGRGVARGTSQSIQHGHALELEAAKKKSFMDQLQNEKFETGLDVVKGMREIVARGNLGRGSGFMGLFGGETAKDRAEYEQLGKSLIPLVAAGVPIRNQKEFEEYRKIITDPSQPESAIEGALSGIERIFEQKLKGGQKEGKSSGKEFFNAANPEHKAKAEQLFKKFKDKERVRKELKREFEGL